MAGLEAIQYVGAKILTPADKATLDTLCAEYYDKIQRELKNITRLKVEIKTHGDKEKTGRVKKFTIKVEALAATRMFEASAFDWDFARTVHKAFKELMTEIQHKLHTDDQQITEKEKSWLKFFRF